MAQSHLFDLDCVPPAPDRQSGLKRLAAFAPAMGSRYARTRNFDLGPGQRQNVSVLSAHVRHRLVLEQELAQTALQAHGLNAAEKFLQEVCWRTYWKGWLARRPSVWIEYLAERDEALERVSGSGETQDAYARAMAGETGIACFDAWAKELVETGYLHNHARMWLASIWIYTLDLPWVLGADWFLRHLIDGDAASNTLSWRWVGGLHTMGKTYMARADNIARYTEGRFTPLPTELAASAPPLSETLSHPPPAEPTLWPLPEQGLRSLVLLHEEDAHPESWTLEGCVLVGVAVQSHPVQRGRAALGEIAEAFTQGALDDLKTRAEACFGHPAILVASTQAVLDLVKTTSAEQIILAPPHEGPMADMLKPWVRVFEEAGLKIALHQRGWDKAFYPYADKGFFKLKSKIPVVLEQLGLL